MSLGSELDIVPGQASTNLYLWMEQKTGKVIEGDQPLKYYVKMVSDGLCLFVLILLLKDNPCGAAAAKKINSKLGNWRLKKTIRPVPVQVLPRADPW